MGNIDDLLSAALYRRSCPAPDTLGDYYLGRLAPAQRLAAALHLRECQQCTAELALYTAPEAEAASVRGDVWAGLRAWVSRVSWLWPAPVATPAPAVRGATPTQRVYEAEGWRVIVEVQPATSGYRRKRLIGKVESPAAPIGAELWSQDDILDSLLVDKRGYFAFDRLKPGAYFLCLRRNGIEIWFDVAVTNGASEM
jgi:anti-sigma factor RsiW